VEEVNSGGIKQMTIEQIIYEKIIEVTALASSTFPVIAPESQIRTFAVYKFTTSDKDRSLMGYGDLWDEDVEVNIVAENYASLKTVWREVRRKIELLQFQTISNIQIQSVQVQPTAFENYENEIQSFSKQLNFKISWKTIY
jgi:hypothetical protein